MRKVHVNVGTIGHIDHGKTTLTAAILAVQSAKGLGQPKSYADIAKGGTVRDATKTVTITASHVQYETEGRTYAHIDCPGHSDYVKNMVCGAAQMDGAVLLLSAVDGVMPQTREHLLLARQVGVHRIVVFVNKCDLVDDEELLELIELEARELLSHFGYDGPQTRFVRGAAKPALDDPTGPASACITELMDALDNEIPDPIRAIDRPFLLNIEGVHTIEGRGTVVTGQVAQGVLRVGQTIEVIGLGGSERTVCTAIESFHTQRDQAFAGENVGVLLRGLKNSQVRRGQVLADPSSIEPRRSVTAEVYVLNSDEGGRHTPLSSGYQPQFFFSTSSVTGTLSCGSGQLEPGQTAHVQLEFEKPIAVEVGHRFAFREGGLTIGSGVVTQLED